MAKQADEIADLQWFDLKEVFKMALWRMNGKEQVSGVWSAGLKACVDIHDGKCEGLKHAMMPFAFNKGKGSIYRAKL